jgi:chromosomal replication initiation ATPase DnaA
MAVSRKSRVQVQTPRAGIDAAALARRELLALLSAAAGTRVAVYQPLVLVRPDAATDLLGDIRNVCLGSTSDGNAIADGRELGSMLATAEAHDRLDRLHARLLSKPFLLVRGVDRLASPHCQHLFARLLDAAAEAGTLVCVSLARTPVAAGLEAALESRLSAGMVLSLPAADRSLDRDAGMAPSRSIASLIRSTARHHGIAAEVLIGHGRQQCVVRIRSVAMYLARRLTIHSLEEIGKAFGGRQHTTVMRSVRSVDEWIRADHGFAQDVEKIVGELRAPRLRRRRHPAG